MLWPHGNIAVGDKRPGNQPRMASADSAVLLLLNLPIDAGIGFRPHQCTTPLHSPRVNLGGSAALCHRLPPRYHGYVLLHEVVEVRPAIRAAMGAITAVTESVAHLAAGAVRAGPSLIRSASRQTC